MRRGFKGLGPALGWALLVAADAADAGMLGFECITFNSATDCATGEAQLEVAVADAGGGLALFTILNTGPGASTVTDVYFDDGEEPLLGALFGLIDRDQDALGTFGLATVDFSEGASPGSLPGHQSIGFKTTKGLAADADPPPAAWGVDPGEWLGIVFELSDGRVFGDVFGELRSGDLRVGLHVQGFDGGGSESFVDRPPKMVPEPGTLVLLGLGMAILGLRHRRR